MADNTEENRYFSYLLLQWYQENKRELPWRETKDPYLIWLSEVILQQTRVAQGFAYYERMVERFPSVEQLAQASEEEVLKYWQGLGYYSRARNLHKAAKKVVADFSGVVPTTYQELLKLPGVGEYTAAAIASFSSNEAQAVVDGNVYRFLSRFFAIDEPINTAKSKTLFTQLAQQLLDKERAGLFNQAIMEFGALQCTKVPDCAPCPFASKCSAKALDKVAEYPVKQKKAAVKDRFFHYFHIQYHDKTFLTQRNESDIWKKLFEFPLLETDRPMSFEELSQTPGFIELFEHTEAQKFHWLVQNKKHLLSHRRIWINLYRVQITKLTQAYEQFTQLEEKHLHLYPVHRSIEEYLLNKNK